MPGDIIMNFASTYPSVFGKTIKIILLRRCQDCSTRQQWKKLKGVVSHWQWFYGASSYNGFDAVGVLVLAIHFWRVAVGIGHNASQSALEKKQMDVVAFDFVLLLLAFVFLPVLSFQLSLQQQHQQWHDESSLSRHRNSSSSNGKTSRRRNSSNSKTSNHHCRCCHRVVTATTCNWTDYFNLFYSTTTSNSRQTLEMYAFSWSSAHLWVFMILLTCFSISLKDRPAAAKSASAPTLSNSWYVSM